MKKYKFIVIIIGIMIAAVLLIVFLDMDKQVETNAKDRRLLEHFDSMDTIQIHADTKLSLHKEGEKWNLEGAEQSLDQSALERFLTAMETMQGEPVEVNKNDVYLDFPTVAVTFHNQEGDKQQITIGQMHPQANKYYVEQKNQEQVYLVDRELIETIPLQPKHLLDYQLLTVQAKDVTEMTIDNGTEVIELSRDSPFSEQEALAHISGWYLQQPYSNYSIAFSMMQEMLQTIQHFEAEPVSDLQQAAGLGDADFTITFKTPDQEEQLIIGDPAANNRYYVQVAGRDDVYTVEAALLEPFSHQAYDMIDPFVYIVPMETLESLEMEVADGSITFAFNHQPEGDQVQTTVYYQGNKLDTEAFREIYKQVIGLTFDGKYEEEELTDTDQARLSFRLQTEEAESLTTNIEFVSISPTHYAIKRENTPIDFVIEKQKVEQAFTSLQHIAANK
ncbi:DUF4340 domain-containing protein [Gracilibacillus alcaliphilus]|uniref:DUF4340 domain-containing protein n=1 Tax=Gracilibacillus alcaliphilus TaxID=1401441 RepID=UPI00195DF1ED|nr:DUF4340 domain-containing protein [Gracilibacillus alcaliphilus]MBM7676428.1 uncharacterized protein YpmB [Gracilibacillus alcaliphilus]